MFGGLCDWNVLEDFFEYLIACWMGGFGGILNELRGSKAYILVYLDPNKGYRKASTSRLIEQKPKSVNRIF